MRNTTNPTVPPRQLKRRPFAPLAAVFGLAAIFILASYAPLAALEDLSNGPIQPLPRSVELDPRKVGLGRKLFHDTRLSANNSISCASCHNIAEGGAAAGLQYAPPGVSGEAVAINVPTVLNSGFNFLQFWDGRTETLEEQIEGPLHNPDEMGFDWDRLIERLRDDSEYQQSFNEIYLDRPSEAAIKDAIATYERSLITPDAPFDRYLRGEADVLSPMAEKGFRLFKNNGCASCHQGANVGGNMFQVFGVIGNYFEDRGNISERDLGRYNVTGRDTDRHVFKVPSLRNVALTPPYFHDGSAGTLEEAVDIMATYQLGHDLALEDRRAIVAFLESLTGILKEEGR